MAKAKVELDIDANTKDANQEIDGVKDKLSGLGKTSKETTKPGLENVSLTLMGLKSGLDLAGQAVQFLGDAFNETGGKFVDYAAQVRDLSRLSGENADSSSRLIQMADDLTIEFDSLKMAAKQAADEGISLNVETLGRLSDEYLAIQDPAKRAQFAIDTFGMRAGPEMQKLLEVGSGALQGMNDEVNRNLILTDEAVKSAREFEIGMDNLNDNVEGLKIKLGEKLIPILNDAALAFDKIVFGMDELTAVSKTHADEMANQGVTWEQYRDEMLRTMVVTGKLSQANIDAWNATAEGKATLDQIVEANFGYTQAQLDATRASEGLYDETSMLLEQGGDNLTYIQSVKDAMEKAGTATGDAADKVGIYAQNASDANTVMQKLTTQLLYNKAAAGLDADAALLLAKSFGLVDDDTAAAMTALDEIRQEFDNGKISAEEYAERTGRLKSTIDLLQSKDITITTEHIDYYSTIYKTGSGGGGGGTGGGSGTVEARANGGPVVAGNPYIWQESAFTRPETLVTAEPGYVLTKQDAMAALSKSRGRGGGVNIYFNNASQLTVEAALAQVRRRM